MRSAFLVAAAGLALLSGCGLGGPDYPTFNETSYRIEGMTAGPDGAAATRTVIYRDGPKMRVETVLPNTGQATIVFDESTNAAYVLNPTGQVATTPAPGSVAPSATTTAPSAAPTTPSTTTPAQPATGAPVTPAPAPGTTAAVPAAPQVIGVAVRVSDEDAPKPLEAAWSALGAENARRVGNCEVAGEDGHEWRPRQEEAGIERVACITDDGIVLRVRENDRVLWEATSLQRGQQDAALFGVPPGYQLIDPAAAAEGVSERMQQLDSVTGAPQPAPAPAPRNPG
jgi:hypothetical protein